MVTFHRFPYEVALKRGKIQEIILRELSEDIDLVDNVDWQKAEKLIFQKLEKLEVE